MKAGYIASQHISVVDRSIPQVDHDEVLVKTNLVGICQTDIELLHGYYHFEGIPGHEFVGTIESAPKHPELIGVRVVADINCGCHQCHRCLQGDPRHCAHRSVIGIRGRDGALAEYLKVPLENIHAVPQQIEDHQAVFTEPLAAALEITQQIHITNTDRVAVIGDGKLGLLIALALKHYCPGLVLLGKHTDNLQIVANQDVATRQVPSEGTLSFLNTIDKDFDIVIDATGKPNGLNMGIELVRPEGTIVLKTTSHLPSQIHFAPVVVKEITLIGSRCGDLSLALSFLKNKWIDVSPLIDSIYPFHDLSKAFSRAQQPGIKKVLISMQ